MVENDLKAKVKKNDFENLFLCVPVIRVKGRQSVLLHCDRDL